MNQDSNCPPLLGEDTISHVNHECLDRNGIASNSQVSTYTYAGSQVTQDNVAINSSKSLLNRDQ